MEWLGIFRRIQGQDLLPTSVLRAREKIGVGVKKLPIQHLPHEELWSVLKPGERFLHFQLRDSSTAGLAATAGATAGNIGLSYLLHRTEHHRLERITSMIKIGASTAAVTFSAIHR
jgi:hypothetical protein